MLRKSFGVPFAKAQTKTPGLFLQEKKSRAELKKEQREKLATEKGRWRSNGEKGTETLCWPLSKHTSSDTSSALPYFWKPQRLEDHGLCKRRQHSPSQEYLQFDKDGLPQEVNAMNDEDRLVLILCELVLFSKDQSEKIY